MACKWRGCCLFPLYRGVSTDHVIVLSTTYSTSLSKALSTKTNVHFDTTQWQGSLNFVRPIVDSTWSEHLLDTTRCSLVLERRMSISSRECHSATLVCQLVEISSSRSHLPFGFPQRMWTPYETIAVDKHASRRILAATGLEQAAMPRSARLATWHCLLVKTVHRLSAQKISIRCNCMLCLDSLNTNGIRCACVVPVETCRLSSVT